MKLLGLKIFGFFPSTSKKKLVLPGKQRAGTWRTVATTRVIFMLWLTECSSTNLCSPLIELMISLEAKLLVSSSEYLPIPMYSLIVVQTSNKDSNQVKADIQKLSIKAGRLHIQVIFIFDGVYIFEVIFILRLPSFLRLSLF